MALGEVVDKGLDVCRDGLIAPSTVAFAHPVIGILPEWAGHVLAALVFVIVVAVIHDVRKHRHHKAEVHKAEPAVRHVPPHKLRRAQA